ncbi:MAG: hypothetical protein QXF12_00355 [Candidatus Aenigmatarchaeota archaeon]
MKYIKKRSNMSKKRKMYSNRDTILMKSALTSNEILVLFGNKNKIIKSEVVINNSNLYAYFLLRGNFFINKKDILSIQAKLPYYIPNKERNDLILSLAEMIFNIDARKYNVVELVFDNKFEHKKEINGNEHFIASPNYVIYNINMRGYTGNEAEGESKHIFTVHEIPHYFLPTYIKFIGDMLERAVYLYDEYEEDY